MQEVDNILIQKVDNYIKNKKVLVEVEALDLSQKLKMTYYDFRLPLSILKESFVCQKIFSFFSILIIRDKENKMIGFKIISDNGIYQFASFSRREKDVSLTQIEKYVISDQELELVLEFEKISGNTENSFIIKSSKLDDKLSSSIILEEKASIIIMQKIEKLMGEEDIKIYQIRRKEIPVLKCNYDLDNIISYRR